MSCGHIPKSPRKLGTMRMPIRTSLSIPARKCVHYHAMHSIKVHSPLTLIFNCSVAVGRLSLDIALVRTNPKMGERGFLEVKSFKGFIEMEAVKFKSPWREERKESRFRRNKDILIGQSWPGKRTGRVVVCQTSNIPTYLFCICFKISMV